MRLNLFFIFLWLGISFPAILSAQMDSLDATRYIVRSTMIGAGKSNVFDTYLSPLEYEGPEIRFLHESMRMTRLMNGHVSVQNLLQVHFSYAKNPAKTGEMYSGLANWNIALHYQFPVSDRLKILFGPMLDVNGGVVYNRRNSNNPAQAKAYASFDASAMLVYKFRIARYPMILRYQANLPVMGAMFSPEFGESYYEMFVLDHKGKHVTFTSFHNNPSIRQLLTLDFPVRKLVMRVGYVCDIQQSKVNHLKTHTYSHDFMIGFVKNLYIFKGKRKVSMPCGLTPF